VKLNIKNGEMQYLVLEKHV